MKKSKKKKLAILVLGAFLVGGLSGCGSKVPEGTVATVNGTPISQEELDMNYTQLLQMYQMYGADITDDKVKISARNSMLESLISQELLLQEAANRGLEVTDEEVAAEIQNLVDESYGGDEAQLTAAVEAAGMTMDYYKEAQKDYLLQSKLQEDLVNHPETVDVIQAKHILIGSDKENAEQTAIDLIAQLDEGADFDTLAKENSDDTASAVDGGELGYFAVNGKTTSKMVDEFTKGAQELEVGEYSKTPVQSQFGYHIIYVEDKQSNVNLLDDSEKYESILSGIYQSGLNNLVSSLQEDAKIEILIDEESVPETPVADNANAADNNDTAGDDKAAADDNGDATGNDKADDNAEGGNTEAAK